jgi:uncharacterized protein (DUF488 family)
LALDHKTAIVSSSTDRRKQRMNKDQPTYKRQRFLLAFIRQLNGEVSLTDLNKLIFMYSQKQDCYFYDFLPYKYGAYSFQLTKDVEILRNDGYLRTDTNKIASFDHQLSNLVYSSAVESLRSGDLIRQSYLEYPYYAINSEIIHKHLNTTEIKIIDNLRNLYIFSDYKLFTIGYESINLESFMNILIKNGVNVLCDVRRNSVSRKLGFSYNTLYNVCRTIGIKFIHIPELGIESDKRKFLVNNIDYKILFADYKKSLYDRLSFLNKVYTLLTENRRIALVCFEKDPAMCHRHIIRDYFKLKYSVHCEDL